MNRLRFLIALLAAALCSTHSRAQGLARPESHPGGILLVVTDKSGLVSNDSPLFLASNHVGWNAGDQSMKLSGRSDLRWQILLPGPVGEPPLAFKFTRGSWEMCEVAADLADINNRTIAPVEYGRFTEGKPFVIELVVERFADEREGAAKPQFRDDSTQALNITGSAVRLQVIGGAGAATGAMRDVIIWLPPGYDEPGNAERRYPVLYMQDGQNVFDFHAPTPAEWGADETATRLIEAGEIEPIIIVAIPHSGANRTLEYLPTNAFGIGGQGDAYIDWLVREVVPRVERVVRASKDPADRGIGGSSLGGLIALRAADMYPDRFGRVLTESPSLQLLGGGSLLTGAKRWSARTFLGLGGLEFGPDDKHANSQYMIKAYKLGSFLSGVQGPVGEERVKIVCELQAEHNEHAWAARFGDALRHLYGAEHE